MAYFRAAFLLALSTCFVGSSVGAKNWALLIQGSKDWHNYCSAASICHAYQTLRASGMPAENIIVMMYDDIANNSQNPYPGKVYNSPNGKEVYEGVVKDYTGPDVTKDTFLAVLRGDKEAIVKLTGRKGRVIESGPDDNIVLYYSDHGFYGLVCMPTGTYLSAKALNDTLTSMYQNKQYANMVIYMEACYSGSMFYEVMSPDINVYAMTAAPPDTQGWMIWCDEQKFQTCLGIEFECNWLGDTDFYGIQNRTFDAQFKEVKKTMTGSVPCEYGDMSISKDVLATFFAKHQTPMSRRYGTKEPKRTCKHPDESNGKSRYSRLPMNMGKIFNIKARLNSAPAHSKLRSDIEKELAAEEKLMKDTETLFLDIARPFYKDLSEAGLASEIFSTRYDKILDWDCYEKALDVLVEMCPQTNINDNAAAVSNMVSLVNLCNQHNGLAVVESVQKTAQKSQMCKPN